MKYARRVMLLVTVLAGFSSSVYPASGWHRGRLRAAQAPEVQKTVEQKLTHLTAGTPMLNRWNTVYVVPLLDKHGHVVTRVRIDAETGDVLEVGQWPADTTGKAVVSINQAKEKVKSILARKCLQVGDVYRNPRGIYVVEIKCKKGKVIALVRTDGKEVF